MLVLVPARKPLLPVQVDVILVDLRLRVARVQVPQRERPLGGQLSARRHLDEADPAVRAVEVLVDLRRDPQPVAVAQDPLVAVGLRAADEYHDLLAGGRADEQRLVVPVLPPPAAPPEQVLQPEAVADADVQLSVGHRRPAGQVELVGRLLQVGRGDDTVVDGLPAADRPLGHAHPIPQRRADVRAMLVRERAPGDRRRSRHTILPKIPRKGRQPLTGRRRCCTMVLLKGIVPAVVTYGKKRLRVVAATRRHFSSNA